MVLGLFPNGEMDARAVIEIIVDKAISFTAKVVKFLKKLTTKCTKKAQGSLSFYTKIK